jgi:hypothetical protein
MEEFLIPPLISSYKYTKNLQNPASRSEGFVFMPLKPNPSYVVHRNDQEVIPGMPVPL